MYLFVYLFIISGVLKYVEQTWLHKYKEMFVSVWVDQSLNFGNRTTNRVESQHAKLKKYLDSSKSNLDKFVKTINEIVQSQLTSINESFEKSRIFRYNHHNLLCFRYFIYTFYFLQVGHLILITNTYIFYSY